MMVEPDPQPQEGDSMRNGNRLQEHLVAARGAVEANDRLAELLEERPADRSKTADRVAYLFPRPETVEWNVRELNYERGRRAELKVS
jgi:hypothetical protein